MDRRTALALVLLTGACGGDEAQLGPLPRPTEVAVDPLDFLGETSCSSHPGSMRSYVVSLTAWDSPDDRSPFPLGSTGAVPCSLLAGFRNVIVVGKRYTAEVDGYQEPPGALRPFGDPSSGARQMVDATSGALVEPRWTTRCGAGPSEAVVAAQNERVFVRPCEPLGDAAGSTTAIAIAPETILGPDPCSVASAFDVLPDDPALAPVTGAACSGDPILYDAMAAVRYGFYGSAVTEDGTAIGTECFALAVAGQTVSPACQQLTSLGTVRISLDGLLQTDGQTPVCPSEHRFDVLDQQDKLNVVPLSCGSSAQIQGLEPGTYLLSVEVESAAGEPYGPGALCSVDVFAGLTSEAFCLANPGA
jgi:hypothetical protein